LKGPWGKNPKTRTNVRGVMELVRFGNTHTTLGNIHISVKPSQETNTRDSLQRPTARATDRYRDSRRARNGRRRQRNRKGGQETNDKKRKLKRPTSTRQHPKGGKGPKEPKEKGKTTCVQTH